MARTHKKITFEDHGQDFLWWEVDGFGQVMDCGPFQSTVWCGSIIDGDYKVGDHVFFETKQGDYMQLNYAIESIEELEVTNG